MRAIGYLLTTLAIALLLGALVLGLTPIKVGDTDGVFSGDGVSCGSALLVDGDLTDFGHQVCELEGGAANRRVQVFAIVAMSVVFFIAGVSAQSEAKRLGGTERT